MDGSTVSLDLTNTITPGSSVTVSYTGNALRDDAGNASAGLDNQSVDNNTADSTAPSLISAVTSEDGNAISLSYDEILDDSLTLDPNNFLIDPGSQVKASPSTASISGSTVTLTPAETISAGDAVSISYTPIDGSTGIADASGNAAQSLSSLVVINNVITTETDAPKLINSATNDDGSAITLTFDMALGDNDLNANKFTVTAADNDISITDATVSTNAVELTLDQAISFNQPVTVSYEEPNKDRLAIQSTDGSNVESFDTQTVINNVINSTIKKVLINHKKAKNGQAVYEIADGTIITSKKKLKPGQSTRKIQRTRKSRWCSHRR